MRRIALLLALLLLLAACAAPTEPAAGPDPGAAAANADPNGRAPGEPAAPEDAAPPDTAEAGAAPPRPDAEQMAKISGWLMDRYYAYYHERGGFPDYYGGSYCDEDKALVLCLTDTSAAVLDEVRAAFCGDPEDDTPPIVDKWFHTIRYERVSNSYDAMYDLHDRLRTALRVVDCGDYQVTVSLRHNRVVVFCQTELAASIANAAAGPALLWIQPLDQWDEEALPPGAEDCARPQRRPGDAERMILAYTSQHPTVEFITLPDYFAGFYLDGDTLVLCLTDTSEPVRGEICAAFLRGEYDFYRRTHLNEWLPTVRCRQVPYSLRALETLEASLSDALRGYCFFTEIRVPDNQLAVYCPEEAMALARSCAEAGSEDALLVLPLDALAAPRQTAAIPPRTS